MKKVFMFLLLLGSVLLTSGCANNYFSSTSENLGENSTSSSSVDEPTYVQETISLTELEISYSSIEYSSLYINQYSDGSKLSLRKDGSYEEFDTGFFAHANSIIVFDNLEEFNCVKFNVIYGLNKSAVSSNGAKFFVYVDGVLKMESDVINEKSDYVAVEIPLESNVKRIALVVDSLGSNGHDHSVWANPILTYQKLV